MSEVPVAPRGAFIRSSVTSALATASDFVVAKALASAGVVPGGATLIGCVAGGAVAFSVNRAWAFQSRGRPARELLRFLFVWALSALLNAGGVWLVTHWGLPFGRGWMLVRGIVYFGWNYPMLRFFVFRKPRSLPNRDF